MCRWVSASWQARICTQQAGTLQEDIALGVIRLEATLRIPSLAPKVSTQFQEPPELGALMAFDSEGGTSALLEPFRLLGVTALVISMRCRMLPEHNTRLWLIPVGSAWLVMSSAPSLEIRIWN